MRLFGLVRRTRVNTREELRIRLSDHVLMQQSYCAGVSCRVVRLSPCARCPLCSFGQLRVNSPHMTDKIVSIEAPSPQDHQGCQRVNSRITRTRIALTRSHTDHSQRVTRFPRVSRIKSLLVYESLALNCHCPFISDVALTPAAAAADHSHMLAARRRFHLPSSLSLGT